MFAVVRMLGIAVGNDHLCEGQAVEDAALAAVVIVRDVVQYDAFSIVEADVKFPILPFYDSTINFEGDAFWLRDVDRLEVVAKAPFGFNRCGMVVVRWSVIDHPSNRRNINMHNLLQITIIYRREVQRE